MEQPTLWDAMVDRDTGMAQVERGADPAWVAMAWDALIDYLHTHPLFFADDFWAETGIEYPRELRALGPIVLRAARAGLIVKTGQYRPSVRSRMGPGPVWRSMIWRDQP